jgi:hypothetical protein
MLFALRLLSLLLGYHRGLSTRNSMRRNSAESLSRDFAVLIAEIAVAMKRVLCSLALGCQAVDTPGRFSRMLGPLGVYRGGLRI